MKPMFAGSRASCPAPDCQGRPKFSPTCLRGWDQPFTCPYPRPSFLAARAIGRRRSIRWMPPPLSALPRPPPRPYLVGRRHCRDNEVAPGDHRHHVPSIPFRSIAQRTLSLKSRPIQIGDQRTAPGYGPGRNGVDLDRMAHHIQHAAAPETRAQRLIVEMHRHRHADLLARQQGAGNPRAPAHPTPDETGRRGSAPGSARLPPPRQTRDCEPARVARLACTERGSSEIRLGARCAPLVWAPCPLAVSHLPPSCCSSRTRLGLDRHDIGHGVLPQIPTWPPGSAGARRRCSRRLAPQKRGKPLNGGRPGLCRTNPGRYAGSPPRAKPAGSRHLAGSAGGGTGRGRPPASAGPPSPPLSKWMDPKGSRLWWKSSRQSTPAGFRAAP